MVEKCKTVHVILNVLWCLGNSLWFSLASGRGSFSVENTFLNKNATNHEVVLACCR